MPAVLTKLDKRHTGNKNWRYMVTWDRRTKYPEGRKEFYDWRTWCWETWGPSKEIDGYLDMFDGVHCENAHWCWESTEYRVRIFLRTDIEAELFLLRWA
jgi:hypothetical protein